MPVLPMFPLGSVLLPAMPLTLRVFEPRYLQMMIELLEAEASAFGVVLIERGFEVGGGDHRFDHGTVARIQSLGQEQDSVQLSAFGGDRIVVEEWLSEEPYPTARVRRLDELEWPDELAPQLTETEQAVRRCLAQASEFADHTYPADIELDENPVARAWQLAGVLPIGPLDRYGLLRSDSAATLLSTTAEQARDAVELLRLSAQEPDDGAS